MFLYYHEHMKKEIITICGGLGSGKSSTAKKVAEILGFRHFSSGDLFRQVAVDLGISVTELNEKAETEPEIDYKVDGKLRDLGKEDKLVIDSRTAYHWIPESFKVYLSLPPEIAKDRVLNNLKENALRAQSESAKTPEEIYEKMIERLSSEQKRFWDLYQIDNTKMDKFDLVVDTNENNLEEVVKIVVEAYKNWISN
jgi:cytidylate kinase